MNICVFCSASDVGEKYNKDAEVFAQLLAEHNHALIWGGTKRGVMNVVATTVQKHGGKAIGVAMELVRDRLYESADEMIVEQSLVERKATMLKRADAFVVMPGGLGTLDEVTEILELKKHGVHNKQVIFLNTDSFFEGIKAQLQRMDAESFLPKPLNELVLFAETPADAIQYINIHGN